MNYKKIGLVLIAASTVVLAGCGNSAKNMSFQETYNAFWDSHTSDAVKMFNNMSSAPALSENGQYVITGSITSGLSLHATVGAKSLVQNEGVNTDSTIAVSGQLTQPGLDDTISLDGTILFKMVSGLSYINLEKLSLASEKGNPQISMIGAFSAILTNKWVSLTSSGDAPVRGLNLSTMYMLPSVIVESLKDHPIFTEVSKEMVDGNPVYHVALDTTGLYLVAKKVVAHEAIQAFLQGTTLTDEQLQQWAQEFVANAAFDGTLTAYSKDNIVLTINKLMLDDAEMLKGTVAHEKTHLEVVDVTASDAIVATIDFSTEGKVTIFSIAAPSQGLSLNGSVDMEKASANAFGYVLSLWASHPSFSFGLRGDVAVNKTDAVVIDAPSSYQTIEQLVGGFWDLVGSGAANSPLMQDPSLTEDITQ